MSAISESSSPLRCLFYEFAVLDEQIRHLIAARGRVDHAASNEADHAGSPLRRYSSAIRTATPLVTCVSMTDCADRATRGSISTPSFIGPGCMTTAPGLACASRSSVKAYVRTYSRTLGNRPPL